LRWSALRDGAGGIAELMDLFARADMLPAQSLTAALTRAAFGFSSNDTGRDDE
jgi:hypothetical protein